MARRRSYVYDPGVARVSAKYDIPEANRRLAALEKSGAASASPAYRAAMAELERLYGAGTTRYPTVTRQTSEAGVRNRLLTAQRFLRDQGSTPAGRKALTYKKFTELAAYESIMEPKLRAGFEHVYGTMSDRERNNFGKAIDLAHAEKIDEMFSLSSDQLVSMISDALRHNIRVDSITSRIKRMADNPDKYTWNDFEDDINDIRKKHELKEQELLQQQQLMLEDDELDPLPFL